jgi:carbamoyltransferase
MSFSPSVREEYRKQLPAVTHIDGSSRLQTVSMSQNKFIYEVLNSFEELTDIPVLINTSFNTRGKAILTRYLEAIKVLDSTGLDGVVLGDYYIYK